MLNASVVKGGLMPVKRRRSFCAKAPLFSFTLLVLLLVISLIGLLIPPDALRQEANAIPEHVMEVKRISTNTLTDRNKIRLMNGFLRIRQSSQIIQFYLIKVAL